MTKTKIYPHELIGKAVEIINSKNRANINLKGKIVDETKMTIKIEQSGKIKVLFKNNIIFKLTKDNLVIDGKDLLRRPEERVKGR